MLSTPPTPTNPADATCAGKCTALAPHEWLALRQFFTPSGTAAAPSLTVKLPPQMTTTYLKKSEVNSKSLPASERLEVKNGAVLPLTATAADADEEYWLVALST